MANPKLPTDLPSFQNLVKKLKPQIGLTGGRFFSNPQDKSYYRMNTLVQNLNQLASSAAPSSASTIVNIIKDLESLDSKGDQCLQKEVQNWHPLSLIKRIGTFVRRTLGNLYYDRTKTLNNLKDTYKIIPLTPTTSTPLKTSTSPTSPTPSAPSAPLKTSTSPTSPTSPTPSAPLKTSTPSTPVKSTSMPAAFNNNNFLKFSSSPSPSINPSSMSSTSIPQHLDLMFNNIEFDEKLSLPRFSWNTVDLGKNPDQTLNTLQEKMIDLTANWLRKKGFILDSHYLPCGINVPSNQSIQTTKDNLCQQLTSSSAWIESLMELLSYAGLLNYADNIRVFWAGQLDMQATLVKGSLSLSSTTDKGPHEDIWTAALRKEDAQFQKDYSQQKSAMIASNGSSLYPIDDFTQWNLIELGKDLNAQQNITSIVLDKYNTLEKNSNTSFEEWKMVLQQITFLQPFEGRSKKCHLQAKMPSKSAAFERIWKDVFDAKLRITGKYNEYYKDKEEAKKLVEYLSLLYASFGQNKIHPISIAHINTQYFAQPQFVGNNEMLRSLQNGGFLDKTPDDKGFYQVLKTNINDLQDLNVLKDYLTYLFQIAAGSLNNRYAARRLAPTFYTTKSGNNNFDIPIEKLPLILKYEDLRLEVVQMVQNTLLNFWKVRWKALEHKFEGTPSSSYNMQFPENAMIVSALIDSLASLGEIQWCTDFTNYLANKNLYVSPYWQKSERTVECKQYADKMSAIAAQVPSVPSIPKKQDTPLDRPYTPAQEGSYLHKRDHLLELFIQGKLLVRVIEPPELIDPTSGIYVGSWNLSYGPNLSTTLIPKEGSKIQMKLFTDGRRGILLSPATVHSQYFGNAFKKNAVTQHNNFVNTLKKRSDGLPLKEVQKNLAKRSEKVELGMKPANRSHTEIAYFRPSERNLVQGLFYKVNDAKSIESLKELIIIQKRLFDRHGILLPIFAYNELKLQEVVVDQQLLKGLGIVESQAVIRTLSSSERKKKEQNPKQYFNLYGSLDTQTVMDGKAAFSLMPPPDDQSQSHWTHFQTLFDLQLMILQLKSPQDKISFTVPKPWTSTDMLQQAFQKPVSGKNQLPVYSPEEQKAAIQQCQNLTDTTAIGNHLIFFEINHQKCRTSEKEKLERLQTWVQHLHDCFRPSKPQITDCSLLDNIHLVFPTHTSTANAQAESQDLFFSFSGVIRFLTGNNDLRKCWSRMALRNLKVFLGVELKLDAQGSLIATTFDPHILANFKDSTDPTGRIPYAKCIARVIQHLSLLSCHDWSQSIIVETRKILGEDFGKEKNIDYFKDSPELRELQTYLTKLQDPNFQHYASLPVDSDKRKSPSSQVMPSRWPQLTTPQSSSSQNNNNNHGILSMHLPPKAKGVLVKDIETQACTELDKLYNKVWNIFNKDLPEAHQKRQEYGKELSILTSFHMYNQIKLPQAIVGAQFQTLLKENAFKNTHLNVTQVQVFYRQDLLPQLEQRNRFIVYTAIVTVNGDQVLRLPKDNLGKYLTDSERRLKRHALVQIGPVTVTATGGYNSPRISLKESIEVYVINTAAPQFEKRGAQDGELEATDFIVDNKKARLPIVTEYYSPDNKPPTYQQLSQEWTSIQAEIELSTIQGKRSPVIHNIMDHDSPLAVEGKVVKLRDESFFLKEAFEKSIYLYLQKLVIPALRTTMKSHKDKKIYLKATAIGTGYFSALGLDKKFVASLQKYVVHALINTYVKLIESGDIPPGSVVDFPFYTSLDSIPTRLAEMAAKKGVEIIWVLNRDLLDFSNAVSIQGKTIDPKKFIRFVLNAGDAYSFPGNESESTSVESMLGNNSDFRQVFAWHFNPTILDPKNHIGV